MGSEAIGSVTVTDGTGTLLAHAHDVKALLESRELILRGPLRRRLPLAELDEVEAHADRLRFRHHDERFELTLGAAQAGRWATKILTPPPTLAARLGISPEHPPLVIGEVTDAALAAALGLAPSQPAATATAPANAPAPANAAAPANAGAPTPANAAAPAPAIAIAQTDDDAALEAALAALPAGLPIWLVHRKGVARRTSSVGGHTDAAPPLADSSIREILRGRGFIDTKVASVSETRTATRYSPRPDRTAPTAP